jgi:hypothetical protein
MYLPSSQDSLDLVGGLSIARVNGAGISSVQPPIKRAVKPFQIHVPTPPRQPRHGVAVPDLGGLITV